MTAGESSEATTTEADVPVADRVHAVVLVLLSGWAVVALLKTQPNAFDQALAALLATGCLWWLFDSPAYEGPGVLSLTAHNGLTAADLGVPPGLFLAAAVLAKPRLRRVRGSSAAGRDV